MARLSEQPCDKRRVDHAALAFPAVRRFGQHLHHLRPVLAAHAGEVLRAGDLARMAVTVDQHRRARIAVDLQLPQQAQHRRNADAAGDEGDAAALLPLQHQIAVRPVDIGPRAERNAAQRRGEVAELLDDEAQVLALARRRGDGERVLAQREDRRADADPGELPGAVRDPLVPPGAQHHLPCPLGQLPQARHLPRAAACQ